MGHSAHTQGQLQQERGPLRFLHDEGQLPAITLHVLPFPVFTRSRRPPGVSSKLTPPTDSMPMREHFVFENFAGPLRGACLTPDHPPQGRSPRRRLSREMASGHAAECRSSTFRFGVSGALGGVLSIVVWPPLVMEFPRLPEARQTVQRQAETARSSATAESTTNTPVNTVPGTTP